MPQPTAPGPGAAGQQSLLQPALATLSQAATGARLLQAATTVGVEIRVASDDAFRQQYGVVLGVTEGRVVTVPASSLADARRGAIVLAHELTHAAEAQQPGNDNEAFIASEARAFVTASQVADELGVPQLDTESLTRSRNPDGTRRTFEQTLAALRSDPAYAALIANEAPANPATVGSGERPQPLLPLDLWRSWLLRNLTSWLALRHLPLRYR